MPTSVFAKVTGIQGCQKAQNCNSNSQQVRRMARQDRDELRDRIARRDQNRSERREDRHPWDDLHGASLQQRCGIRT